MIKKINNLKKFGIFQNYAPEASLADFNRFNLFYGWNGSGKSTLSTLFESIERKKQSEQHIDSEWQVLTDLDVITQVNVNDNSQNIRVFNKDFVIRNIFTPDEKVKGILYVSEGKVDEKLLLEKTLTDLNIKQKRFKEIEILINGDPQDKKTKGLVIQNETFLSDAAKSIKANFKVIEIEDSRLLNYNKTKLSDFIVTNEGLIKAKKNTLSVYEIEKLSKSIKPQDKTAIDEKLIIKFDTSLLEKIYNRVKELQLTTITAKTIERLKENPSIAEWVYQGLREIHSESSLVCEFCGQNLPESRIGELNQHFSDEFEKLKQALLKGIEWIEQNRIKTEFPHESILFDEFQSEYKDAVIQYNRITFSLNNKMNDWLIVLEEKQGKPFDPSGKEISKITELQIEAYETAYNSLLRPILEHNKKFNGLEEAVKENKQKLELHYISEEVAKFGYFEKKESAEKLLKERDSLKIEIDGLNASIKHLRASLSDDILGAEEFNLMLHKFLGRNDLCLDVRSEGGYIIKRNQNEEAKGRSLSEGERTAIALVYFIAKLKEDGNKVEDTIIVIDDPISSFDSNHLFHANYFIKNECDAAKQLFVFTHNFRFFSMQKEWIKTKIGKDGNNRNIDLFNLFLIKPKQDNGQRNGNIENADNVLSYFDSEYHLLFSEVKKFSDNPQMDYISTHTIANICRQLLESFLSFKFGRRKLEKCFDDITGFEDLQKVRKFVNHYSHKMDNGEAMNGFNDNVFGEADKIVPKVLDLIKHVDSEHFISMTARLNNN